MTEWQPIETAPRDRQERILYGLAHGSAIGWWSSYMDEWTDGENFFPPDEITHWMPLPEPPK